MSNVDFTAGALPYAERLGWKVLLLAPGRKVPFISKANGGNGVHDATSNPDQIRTWGRICPNGNIAVACGEASGIIVLDIDLRDGGDASLATLAAKGRVLPAGPRQRTGNRGWHYLFKADPRIRSSAGRLGRGIDVKSTGGAAVVAPSWTAKSDNGPGGPYVWEVSPFDVAIPRMPLWMTQMLCPPPLPRPIFAPNGKGGALESLLQFVAESSKGERNNRLHWAASRAAEMAARRLVSAQSAGHRLVAAAAVCGYVGPEVVSTINSAFARNGVRFEVR